MAVYKAPENVEKLDKKLSIFLGGTIDMGSSIDWQEYATKELRDDFDIFNPRRDFWNDGHDQKKFEEQVNWELDRMHEADIILMNLLPDSKSPISLMEIGLHATDGKLVVVCPKEFWRSGNVQIVCDRWWNPCFDSLDEAINYIKGIQ